MPCRNCPLLVEVHQPVLELTLKLITSMISEPGVIAKSSVTLDVKPWDDETDMKDMETKVRSIVMDGLLWGACMYDYPRTRESL